VTSRSARSFLVAALAAVHTAVMLLGACLHELPGGCHDAGMGMGSTACDRHPGDHAPATRQSSDDCLVCQLLSLGQLPVAVAGGASSQLITPFGPLIPPPLVSGSCRNPSRPRAPPVAAVA
jgi:hypothetical protein